MSSKITRKKIKYELRRYTNNVIKVYETINDLDIEIIREILNLYRR